MTLKRQSLSAALVPTVGVAASAPFRPSTLASFSKDFLRFMGPSAVPAGLLLLLGALVESIGLLLLLPLLSVVLDTSPGSPWLEGFTGALLALVPGASRFSQIALLLGLFGLVMAARGVIILWRDVLLTRLQVAFVESHRIRIVELLANTGWDVISRLRHGRITHVLGQDVQACGHAATLLLQSTISATMLIGQFILVVLLSPTLAGFVLLIAFVSVLTIRPLMRRSRETGTSMTETQLNLMNTVTQFLGGLKLAVSQNLQSSFVGEFKSELGKAADLRVAFARQRSISQLAVTSWAAGGAGLAILIGVGFLDTAPATLIAFLFIIARMSGPAGMIQSGIQHILHSLPAYGKIVELQEELKIAQPVDLPTTSIDKAPQGPIEFRDVTYFHERGRGSDTSGGVCNLNLRIEPGEFIGLTGPSGAGKTTFLDLLVGLYPPQKGRIAIGGVPLGQVLALWRRRIAYVAQDSFLFHDSIRNNLLWAAPDADEEALWQALAEVEAAPLVKGMENGLDTVVGERGTLLSGGERQRIALARALLRKPVLLLLDEATNAIDAQSERTIIERIAQAPDRPTIILVAHRQESLALCDNIVTFEAAEPDDKVETYA